MELEDILLESRDSDIDELINDYTNFLQTNEKAFDRRYIAMCVFILSHALVAHGHNEKDHLSTYIWYYYDLSRIAIQKGKLDLDEVLVKSSINEIRSMTPDPFIAREVVSLANAHNIRTWISL